MRIGQRGNTQGYEKAALMADGVKKYKSADGKAEKNTQKASETPAGDVVEISEDARASEKSRPDKPSKFEEMMGNYQTLLQELERAKEQGDAMAEEMKMRIRCLRIAMRIMSGNKVSEKDLKYLMENDPEMYGKALMMRQRKVDPKELDDISEDEEDGDKTAEGERASAEGSAESVTNSEVQTEGGAEASTDTPEP